MVRIERLGSTPDPAAVERLRGRPAYHSDLLHGSHAWLRESGVETLPIPPEGLPDGAILILPSDGSRSGPLYDVVQLMDRLLGPGGCPWDQVQTHESLKKCLLEETYEVLEAVDLNDDAKLCEELGDLLLQPIMHAQIAALSGRFDSDAIARNLVEKLVRRHPHVFGDAVAPDPEAVLKNWQAIKAAEKGEAPASLLSGIPKELPSLFRALKISSKAAKAGFEWPDLEAVWDKVREEEAELRHAIEKGDAKEIESEMGDLLFTIVNVARWLKVDPEDALRQMLDRFSRRFARMEELADQSLQDLSPEAWDQLWTQAKTEELKNS